MGGQTNLEGADYFWFFTKLMMATAFLFLLVARLYKPREYLQEEADGHSNSEPITKRSSKMSESDFILHTPFL